MDYLHRHKPEHSGTVIDVGCGWGLAGIWCAKTMGSKVTSVDADPSVFPYLQAAATLNGVSTEHSVSKFEKLSTKKLAEYDMLIAADICFWKELVDPVNNMINRAVKAGVKQILIADPERSPFFEVADRCMRKHCAELVEWKTSSAQKAQGAILVIHNA
jgi:predicted nicotinamide N-methyase